MDYLSDLLFEYELRAIDVIVISVISTIAATIIISLFKYLVSNIKNYKKSIKGAIRKLRRRHRDHNLTINEVRTIQEKVRNGKKLRKFERKGVLKMLNQQKEREESGEAEKLRKGMENMRRQLNDSIRDIHRF